MKVLITGGTGLIGTRMTDLLLDKGYEVAYLSRSKKQGGKVQYYQWDSEKQFIEEGAIETADYIIHLAGAGVADERWTPSRKEDADGKPNAYNRIALSKTFGAKT